MSAPLVKPPRPDLSQHRPLSGEGPIQLALPTPAEWLPHALANFDSVLIDHAHCEKKAAANALSMLQAYPEVPGLPAQMARLAREESAHLARVLQIMESRGLSLSRDGGDPYAQRLQKHIRTGALERRLDRLLAAAMIEARSCERLALLASGLEDAALARFYRELAQSEDGHQALFFRLAASAHGEEVARERLAFWIEAESQAMQQVGIRAAVH